MAELAVKHYGGEFASIEVRQGGGWAQVRVKGASIEVQQGGAWVQVRVRG